MRTIIAGSGYSAVIEDGKLMEYIPEDNGDLTGAILFGRIDRMMPGLNCAFVDIGRKKNGFLPLNEESSSFAGGAFRSGDILLLQIRKEEKGEKGVFLSRDITLPGCLVILMPMNRYVGVSSRIKNEAVRERLKKIAVTITGRRYGIVMRNAAAEADENEIRKETEALLSQWRRISKEAEDGGSPGKVFRYGEVITRLKEDYAAGGYDIATESDAVKQEIEHQLKQAYERKIRLPGGGTVVIDRCEAMTVIDVNTSSFTGAGFKELTILHTNLEACELIAQQIRLRNIGGIILIDFIDMEEETDRSLVLESMNECFRNDRIKTVIHGWTHLGLMEMTRKRTGKEIGQER